MKYGIAVDLAPLRGLERQVGNLVAITSEAEKGTKLESVWLGENFDLTDEPFHAGGVLLILASLASRTRLRLGTGVLLVPGYEPSRLVQDIATLDELSEGRVIVGAGLGRPRMRQHIGFQDGRTGGQVMDAFYEHASIAWSQSSEGKYLTPEPRQVGGPPMFNAGFGNKAIERTVRWKTGHYIATNYSDEMIVDLTQRFEELTTAAQTPPLAVNRLCLVDTDHATATSLASQYFSPITGYYRERGIWEHDRSGTDTGALVGTPSEIIEKLRFYQELGITQMNFRIAPHGMPLEVAQHTVALLNQEILPHLAGMCVE